MTAPLSLAALLCLLPAAQPPDAFDPPPPADPVDPPVPGEFEAGPFDDVPPPPAEGSVGGRMQADDPALDPALDPSFDPNAAELADPDAFAQPPLNPLLDPAPVLDPAPDPAVELPLDPLDPDVKVIVDPAVTVLTPAPVDPLAELIRNPYDIYDLREHAAIPADCLLARQACLPCTLTVTSCAPCGCGATVSQEIPVPGVNPMAAEQIAQILISRTPADPRVSYLLFVLRYREGRYDEALSFLEDAVRLELADPAAFPNYAEFMSPIQGRSRVYLERVRRLAGL